MSTLRVGLVSPDPPFTSMPGDGGLDVELTTAIADALGVTAEFVPYPDAEAHAFADLDSGRLDCVAAGLTVTPEREQFAAFAPPYLIAGQALVVDTARHPEVRSIDDVAGLTVGVRRGDAGHLVAEEPGRAGRVVVCGYEGLHDALAGLSTAGCDAFVGLGPVLAELVKDLPGVEIVQRGLSREPVAIAVARSDTALLDRIGAAQQELEADGTLQRIRRSWLGNPFTDQQLALY